MKRDDECCGAARWCRSRKKSSIRSSNCEPQMKDGYYSRSQYGSYSNGSQSILAAILEQILGMTLLD